MPIVIVRAKALGDRLNGCIRVCVRTPTAGGPAHERPGLRIVDEALDGLPGGYARRLLVRVQVLPGLLHFLRYHLAPSCTGVVGCSNVARLALSSPLYRCVYVVCTGGRRQGSLCSQ